MSPLRLALLLRAYSMPRPNQDIPAAQAFAPAMVEALMDFRDRGIIHWGATVGALRYGRDGVADLLTPKGTALVRRILGAATEFDTEAA